MSGASIADTLFSSVERDTLQLILLYTKDLSLTRTEIVGAGGRIVHVLTPSVIVASLPENARLHTCTTARPSELDPMSVRAADAWLSQGQKSSDETSIPWDTPGYEPPD